MEPLSAAFEIFLSMLFTVKDVFLAPLLYPALLWVAVPIYLNLIVTEYFDEKVWTRPHQALTNAFMIIWVGIDWLRTTSPNYSATELSYSSMVTLILATPISVFLILYGLAVFIMGIKRSRFIQYFGRIREASYALIFLTPVFYGVFELTPMLILTFVAFFPIFYFTIEGIDRLLPTPQDESLEATLEKALR